MKNAVKVLVTLFAGALLSSCLQSGIDLTVNKDGSGELVQTFKIQREYMSFLNMNGDANATADPNLIDRDQLTKLAAAMGEGVTLSKVEAAPDSDPYGGYKAYFTFKDISKVKTPSSPMTTPGEEAENTDWITFQFNKGGTAKLTVLTPFESEDDTGTSSADDTETTEEQPQSDQEKAQMEQMKQIYKTMHFWFKIHVKGTITNTNARYSDKSEVVIMDMLFDKIVENDKLFREMTAENGGNNLEKMRKELEDAGVKVDDTEKIQISFR